MVHNKNWWKYCNIEPLNEFDKKEILNHLNIMLLLSYINALVNSINPKAKIKYLKCFLKTNINSMREKKLSQLE